ncbi:MAG: sigma-70 family RNA polymerase sigma factor [Elusimicrobia bacterium]|nr:sigma-70 family RNA polymerase sigma factor [Elusimicrobiota bacterium]
MGPPDKKELAARENALAERFIGGDVSAFADLVELYKDRVHRFITCILGPDRESEDIAQEVFIQVYRSLESFRRESRLSTWIYALARNVCRRRLRERGREAGLFAAAADEDGYEPPDAAPSAESAFEGMESGRAVRDAVDGLSPLHRSVIFLSCWEQLSYQEIADALDIPVGTVRSRIHNAMAALAARLKAVLAPERGEKQ